MLLSTANIRGNPLMSQPKVRRDVKLVKSRSTVVGWQEIKKPRYKTAVGDIYRDDWETVQLSTPIPISVRRRDIKVLKSGHQLTHHGRAGASPNRYVSWALCAELDSGLRFVVMNTHYVSGAWNHKPKYAKAWRQRMWQVHWTVQKQLVTGFHQAGYSIVGTGDFNRREVRRFHPAQEWLGHRGIDKIWTLQGHKGPALTNYKFWSVDLNSDHHLRTAQIRLG